jgi:adenylate cyclase
MAETRKLAAILAADVVGYSRLAGTDEDRTLARLRALRSDRIDPTIAVHNGRVVKRTGDGALVEFRSVVDAVRCAIELQNGMVERNAGLPPERRIEFRVGIHVGDVVEESDGDLMGDGVNIAARLEGICEPGAICLSEQAYWQVKSRLDLAVSDLGPTHLKNIAEPVRVYSLEVGAAPAKPASQGEPATPEASARLALPNKPSIAVLAFQNMSGDPERAAGGARAGRALCGGGGCSQGGEPRAHQRAVARSRNRGASLGPGCVKSRTDAMIFFLNRRAGATDVRLCGRD